jgi:hypothetical protein
MQNQTIYLAKESPELQPPDNIENLSLEEIENLLPQFQASLEESKKKPIWDVVDEIFAVEWSEIEKSLEKEFEDNLYRDRMNFFIKTSLKTILNSAIGEEITRELFKTINYCQETQNFKGTQMFFQKFKGPDFYDIREAAKVAFAVYRLNKRNILGDEYFGKPASLRSLIRDSEKVDSQIVKNVVFNFRQCKLID